MSLQRATCASLLIILGLASGCESSATRPTQNILRRAPPIVHHTCARAQAVRHFMVLCPSLLPRPVVGMSPGEKPARLYVRIMQGRLENGEPVRANNPSWYFIDLGYGAPYEDRSSLDPRNNPRRFLHLGLMGGVIPQAALQLNPIQNRPRPRKWFRNIGGHPGTLYYQRPRTETYFSGHFTFVWKNGSVRYVVSLHGWKRSETLALLGALIRSLKPVAK